MKSIVISQPMFFPWVGLFEQYKLSDFFIHFDNVQLPQGRSFTNRVQIKTKDGFKWLTVPLRRDQGSKILIKDCLISYESNWIKDHLSFLSNNYSGAKHKSEMLHLVEQVYKNKFEKISDLNVYATELIASYLNIQSETNRSSNLVTVGSKSELLLSIIKQFDVNRYITGHGAYNYIDYELFQRNAVDVEYIQYKMVPYPQLYGAFTPYVSILDLIAIVGADANKFLVSETIHWKNFQL